MKQFRVTVNGQTYDVVVEEVAGNTPAKTSPAATIPAPAPVPTPAPAAPQAPVKAATPTAGGHAVTAPMPGVVLSVSVKVGQTVKAGEVLLILEAMKMENEINAPSAGTVKEISVSQGATVNTGDIMVVIE